MIIKRPSSERGQTNIDWLQSFHSFSFGGYRDPRHMGFGPLRVINEDIVAPSGGFSPHDHRDMEIITYILSGALAHKDSMGNGTTIHTGEMQKMSAGSGIEHSEFNASATDPVHLLQIWIIPDKRGIAPNYAQEKIAPDQKHNKLHLAASNGNLPGVIPIEQDAKIYVSALDAGKHLHADLTAGRKYWLQIMRGELRLSGLDTPLIAGDGAAVIQESAIELQGGKDAEFLLFDLPEKF